MSAILTCVREFLDGRFVCGDADGRKADGEEWLKRADVRGPVSFEWVPARVLCIGAGATAAGERTKNRIDAAVGGSCPLRHGVTTFYKRVTTFDPQGRPDADF